MRKAILVLAAVTLPLLFASCKQQDNAVARFLEHSELQYEGDVQKETIKEALKDILAMDEKYLREKRYRDYTGKENQWDLQTLIYRHFVPSDQSYTLGDHFYSDVRAFAVKMKINRILIDLD